ncbi:MAG: FG-GAP repeat protein, partial [Thermoplasmata archaeon]|nr:FG-GAP repeat protein [Thermoplasmata archaeon]
SGLNATANTPGPTGANDDWDWYLFNISGVYGGDDSAVEYNADPDRDNSSADSTVAADGELIISIGEDHGDGSDGGGIGDSGAYGLELQITATEMALITAGGTAKLSFEWYFQDIGNLNPNEEAWVKCRFGDTTTMNYLGTALDTGDNNADGTNEIWWADSPYNTAWTSFSADLTSYISSAGLYYLDFGGKLRNWGGMGPNENGIFHFDNILLKITNLPEPIILQGLAGTAFGSCVAGLNNFNEPAPGYDDVAVGAPLTNKGSTYVFYGAGSLPSIIPVANADIELDGIDSGELFGWAVANAGDLNNDNYNDIIVGAPGADRVYIYYGRTAFTPPAPTYANLWDDNPATPNVVDFDFTGNEVNTLANTFGLATPPTSNEDDGWDWANGTYGQNLKGGPWVSYHYDPEPESDGLTLDGSNRLEAQVGPSHAGSDGSNQEVMDSAAWGVQIDIDVSLYAILQNGGKAVVSFDWEAQDTEAPGSGTEERSYVKARIGNATGYYYLGSNLGGDPEQELFFHQSGFLNNPWASVQGFFQGDITQYFDQVGWYYLDFGAKFDASAGGSNQAPNEGMRAYFDNISMAFYPRLEQDIIINGTPGDQFGFSVSSAGKLNSDDFDDVIIGAPGNDTVNGVDSGAIYVFLSNDTLNSKLDAAVDAALMNYGEAFNDSFGRAVAHAGSVDGDIYSEVLVGAPYNNSVPSGIMNDVGKGYVFSLIKRPDIMLNYPVGGEFLGGEIIINATAIDPDDNIDAVGVRFYYSIDLINWILIGSNAVPDSGMYYTLAWNTTLHNDSTYYIKVNLTDKELNFGEDISGPFTVDNQYPPLIDITHPTQSEVIYGLYTINTTGLDDPRDQLGGGINTSMGVRFYYSDDNSTWIHIGNDTTPGPGDLYQIDLDTTTMFDGNYWLKAEITDLENISAEDIVEFVIDNPPQAPYLELLAPRNVTEVMGVLDINATAYDMDNNINSSGVSFYYSDDDANWIFIDNDPTPDTSLLYQTTWDTTTVDDAWYWVKAFVNDTTNLTATAKSDKFKIHNNINNPPKVTVIYPNNGEELRVNVKLKADAYDVDDNLDSEGVKFYYSANKIDWTYIGNKPVPDVTGGDHFTFIWNTLKVPDGRYWLNASANDTTNLVGWDHSDEPFFIHNSQLNPPFLEVAYPNGGETLSGTTMLTVGAIDLEDNIDANGVRFYYSQNKLNWTLISNVTSPSTTSTVDISPPLKPYELLWDTTRVPDGVYWLSARATDTHNLTGEDLSDGPFIIHNGEQNAPLIDVKYPNGGEELNGTVTLQVTGFDLEDNIDVNGVKFYYSSDEQNWNLIGKKPNGTLSGVNVFERLYVLSWDTTSVPDGYYWLKADATDLTALMGEDVSDDAFIIHNNLVNPPQVKIIQPIVGDTISSQVEIQVEVTDLENNVDEVRFYYSDDNLTWELIGTDTEPDGNIYSYTWDSRVDYDGEYYFKVEAVDSDNLTGEGYTGKVFVDNDNPAPGKKESDAASELWWLWIVLVIIIVLICLFAIAWKKRQDEKVKATLTSMSPQAIPVSGAPGPTAEGARPALATPVGEGAAAPVPGLKAAPAVPALLPAAGAGEGEKVSTDFEQKIATWKSQGYNVSRLEQLITTDMEKFWDVLPIFITNINKLDELKPRFNALDTTGHEAEAESIRKKLNEPDLALAVEREVIMLEDKLEIKHKLAEEEAAEEVKAKEEEATADFGEFLPTKKEGEGEAEAGALPDEEPSEGEAVEAEMEEELQEAEQETPAEDEEDIQAAEGEFKQEMEAADEELEKDMKDDDTEEPPADESKADEEDEEDEE